MTTRTVWAFIFTGITAPVAIVSGIWLARLPAPQPPHTGFPRHLRPPHPARLRPGGHPADLHQLAPGRLLPRGRHHR